MTAEKGEWIVKATKPTAVICVLSLILIGLPLAAPCDDQPTTIAQDNEQKASLHYLAGESANKSGDLLTAIVEWQTALTLKPTSEFTAKCLLAAARKLTPEGKEAYAHFVNLTELQRQGKIDEAEAELSLASAYKPDGKVPACLTAKATEIAELKKLAAKPPAPEPKTTAPTTDIAATKETTTTPPAAAATTTKPETKSAATTKLKSKASASATPKTNTLTAPRKNSSTRKAPASSVRRNTRSAPRPPSRPTLHYQHGYTINGKRVPGHWTIKPAKHH